MAEGAAAGGPRNAVDVINAATAAANSCTVLTRRLPRFLRRRRLLQPAEASM
jgi:predicted nucleic acid-binding protein